MVIKMVSGREIRDLILKSLASEVGRSDFSSTTKKLYLKIISTILSGFSLRRYLNELGKEDIDGICVAFWFFNEDDPYAGIQLIPVKIVEVEELTISMDMHHYVILINGFAKVENTYKKLEDLGLRGKIFYITREVALSPEKYSPSEYSVERRVSEKYVVLDYNNLIMYLYLPSKEKLEEFEKQGFILDGVLNTLYASEIFMSDDFEKVIYNLMKSTRGAEISIYIDLKNRYYIPIEEFAES